MRDIQEYCVGLAFDQDEQNIILIKKNRPEWMVGKLNGVGGKVERGEQPLAAMRREFQEEAGILIHNWGLVAKILNDNHLIYVYQTTVWPDELDLIRSVTDEEVDIYCVNAVLTELTHAKPMPNLKTLIPLALNRSFNRPVYFYDYLHLTDRARSDTQPDWLG